MKTLFKNLDVIFFTLAVAFFTIAADRIAFPSHFWTVTALSLTWTMNLLILAMQFDIVRLRGSTAYHKMQIGILNSVEDYGDFKSYDRMWTRCYAYALDSKDSWNSRIRKNAAEDISKHFEREQRTLRQDVFYPELVH